MCGAGRSTGMEMRVREGYEGTGPGAITPDGCAVELYSRLTPGTEPEVVASAAPPGAHILELGSGVGRITHALLERGFQVTAVDESPEMLARVRGARKVCSPIERLDLPETYEVVLLASFLVHAGDVEVRRGLLRTCVRHLKPGGGILIQREGAEHHTDVPRERTDPAGGTIRIASSTPVGDGVHSVHVEYVFPDAVWTQTHRSRPMTDEQFAAALSEEGLKVDRVLTEDGMWVRVVPVEG